MSLHVYAPALTYMTLYELRANRLVARGVCWPASGDRTSVAVRRRRSPMSRTVRADAAAGAGPQPRSSGSTPSELEHRHAAGALVIDIRPDRQRAAEGEFGYGLVVERNVLEWRFDLQGGHTLEEVTGYDQPVIVVCSEGYASSLAADVAAPAGVRPGRRPGGWVPGLVRLAHRDGGSPEREGNPRPRRP